MKKMLAWFESPDAMKVIDSFESIFKDLPHLPKGITKFLASLLPWVAGFVGVVSILSALVLTPLVFGLEAAVNTMARQMGIVPAGYEGEGIVYYLVSIVILVMIGWLYVAAFGPLRRKEAIGWTYIFWGNIISVVQVVVGIIFIGSNIVTSVISVLIGFYVLFEMKPLFSKSKQSKIE